MFKILFINASPRQNGFTVKALREIQYNIGSDCEYEWLDINNLDITPCQGCLQCRPDKECVLPEDDAHRIASLIKGADALILGSPTYFGNITGPLRMLVDRVLTALETIDASGLEFPIPLHRGQKAAIVTACNMPYPGSKRLSHGYGALQAMKTVLNAGGYDLVGEIMVDGAGSRDGLSESMRVTARQIACNLVM